MEPARPIDPGGETGWHKIPTNREENVRKLQEKGAFQPKLLTVVVDGRAEWRAWENQ